MPLDSYLESDFGSFDAHSLVKALPAEGHVEWWRGRPAMRNGSIDDLVMALPHLRVPVVEGASRSETYRRLVLAGESDDPGAEPVDGIFQNPDGIHASIHEHPAGDLPIIELESRSDFERAFRALGSRCEPVDVSPSVHALYVSGLPNAVRASELRRRWIEEGGDPSAWPAEMKRLRASDPTAFHDRLILLHPAPYGGIPSHRVDPSLDEAGWTERSRILRLEHEFAHHATHRLLGSYRLHVHDEVLADLMGFTRSVGLWDPDLFLLGLGIEGGRIRPDARLHAYVGSLCPKDLPDLLPVLDRVARQVAEISDLFSMPDSMVRLRRLLLLAEDGLRRMTDGDWPASFRDRASA